MDMHEIVASVASAPNVTGSEAGRAAELAESVPPAQREAVGIALLLVGLALADGEVYNAPNVLGLTAARLLLPTPAGRR